MAGLTDMALREQIWHWLRAIAEHPKLGRTEPLGFAHAILELQVGKDGRVVDHIRKDLEVSLEACRYVLKSLETETPSRNSPHALVAGLFRQGFKRARAKLRPSKRLDPQGDEVLDATMTALKHNWMRRDDFSESAWQAFKLRVADGGTIAPILPPASTE